MVYKSAPDQFLSTSPFSLGKHMFLLLPILAFEKSSQHGAGQFNCMWIGSTQTVYVWDGGTGCWSFVPFLLGKDQFLSSPARKNVASKRFSLVATGLASRVFMCDGWIICLSWIELLVYDTSALGIVYGWMHDWLGF